MLNLWQSLLRSPLFAAEIALYAVYFKVDRRTFKLNISLIYEKLVKV